MRRTDLSAYCPECLVEAPYWRQVWQIRYYIVCSKHGSYLIDQCQKCLSNLKFKRFSLIRCGECAYDLRGAKSLKADPAPALWFSQVIANNDQSTFDHLSELHLAMKNVLMNEYEKMHFIYLYHSKGTRENAKLYLIEHLILTKNECHPRIQLLGFDVARGMWKMLMREVLQMLKPQRIAYTDKNVSSLSKIDTCRLLNCNSMYLDRCLYALQIELYKEAGGSKLIGATDIRRLLSLRENLPDEEVFRLSSKAKEYSQFGLTLKEVAAELRLKFSEVLFLIKSGQLVASKLSICNRVPQWFVNAIELERFKQIPKV